MAVRTNGDLQVTSLVLRRNQVQRMDTLRELRSTRANRATRSDIAREVFEAGLDALFRELDSTFTASLNNADREAA